MKIRNRLRDTQEPLADGRHAEAPRTEITCTGGLYDADERTGTRITLDRWFREVHSLVKDGGVWRFLGNVGEVTSALLSRPHGITRSFDGRLRATVSDLHGRT